MTGQKPLAVLVTGAAGFVGSALVPELLRRGHRIVATSRREPTTTVPGLSWVHWDASVQPLPKVDWGQLDAIVHLAAPTHRSATRREHFALSVAATFALLEAAGEHGLERFVLASTGDVLGPRDGAAVEGDVLYQPGSFYGTARACAELLCRSHAAAAVLRFYHPYGPGGDRFLVNRLLAAVAQGEEVTIDGPEGIALNPVWVEDLAGGICRAVEAGVAGTFHLAGPETVTLRGLLELAGELVGRTPRIRSRPVSPGGGHVGRWDRAAGVLGFAPRTALREGLERLLAGRSEGCGA